MLLGVIPKREPEEPDGDWLEDDPSVHLLIDVAVTLNEVLRPRRGTVIADAIEAGSLDAQAAAVRAHVRQQVGPHQEHSVMELALAIIRARAES